MFKFVNFKKLTAASVIGLLMTGTFQVSPSASVNSTTDITSTATGSLSGDNPYRSQIKVTESTTIERTVTVEIPDIVTSTTTEKPQKLDVLFLADNTGSMGPAITNVQDHARSLLQTLSNNYNDIQVGVAKYYGDPSEYGTTSSSIRVYRPVKYTYSLNYTGDTKTCSNRWGRRYTCYKYDVVYDVGGEVSTWTSYYSGRTRRDYGDSYTTSWVDNSYVTKTPATAAYELQESVNGGSINDAIDAINSWKALGGGDWEEANFFALHQAATSGASIDGYATGSNTNWRSDAKKIIVWFGDAQSHTSTINNTETIQALNNNDISVVAIHTSSTDRSLTQGLDAGSQASSIASATSGKFASVYSSELATTMLNLIGTVALVETTNTTPGIIDLTLISEGDTNGLDITYTCIDPLGCNGVRTGDSRQFRMDVIGNTAGTYNFNTVVQNVSNAVASNNIEVLSGGGSGDPGGSGPSGSYVYAD